MLRGYHLSVNKGYTIVVPFLSRMVYKRVKGRNSGKASQQNLLLSKPPPPPPQHTSSCGVITQVKSTTYFEGRDSRPSSTLNMEVADVFSKRFVSFRHSCKLIMVKYLKKLRFSLFRPVPHFAPAFAKWLHLLMRALINGWVCYVHSKNHGYHRMVAKFFLENLQYKKGLRAIVS